MSKPSKKHGFGWKKNIPLKKMDNFWFQMRALLIDKFVQIIVHDGKYKIFKILEIELGMPLHNSLVVLGTPPLELNIKYLYLPYIKLREFFFRGNACFIERNSIERQRYRERERERDSWRKDLREKARQRDTDPIDRERERNKMKERWESQEKLRERVFIQGNASVIELQNEVERDRKREIERIKRLIKSFY